MMIKEERRPFIWISSGGPVEKTYKSVLVSISEDAPVDALVNAGLDHLSIGGKLLLVYVIEVPSQLPYMYVDACMPDAKESLNIGLRLAKRRNADISCSVLSARDLAHAIIELAVQNRSGLIVICRPRRTIVKKLLLYDPIKKMMKTSSFDLMVFNEPTDAQA